MRVCCIVVLFVKYICVWSGYLLKHDMIPHVKSALSVTYEKLPLMLMAFFKWLDAKKAEFDLL